MNYRARLFLGGVAFAALTTAALAQSFDIDFSTFVAESSIAAVEGGNHSANAFNFAQNKFVGSVYFGNQLFQTDLSGNNIAVFGSPLPDPSKKVGEVVVGAALGQGGFAAGDIYAGSEANGNIYHYANSGGDPSLFAAIPVGRIRQIFFDPGTTFNGDMLVTSNKGDVYEITSAGAMTLLAALGEDSEGMDIATSAWGPYAGYLLVGSEGSGTIRLVSPTGGITVVLSAGSFPGAENIAFVPLDLDSTDPLQGFYVSNYPLNIQFAPAGNFTSMVGDAVVTDEFGGSTAWDVHYNSDGTFTQTKFTFTGNKIRQFEDGIFVTPQRIVQTGCSATANFGTLYLGKQRKLECRITNPGTAPVAVTGLSITLGTADASAYTYHEYCGGTIPPGKSCQIAVYLTSDEVGTLTATLNVASSAPVSPQQIGLTGTVIDPVPQFSPSALKFGTVVVGSSATLPLQLTNAGQTDLDIGSVAVGGTVAGDFSQTNNCPAALGPAAGCTIEVTFTPAATGAPSALLTIGDNVVGGKSAVVLAGFGAK